MADDIEQRLTAAAEALREYEVTTRRRTDLRDRMAELTRQIDTLRAQHADEQDDVERLEGVSLARVLAALQRTHEDALARERAEADAVLYRVLEAEARLNALKQAHDAVQERLGQLAAAPSAYAAMLDERERYLRASSDPRGMRLLDLADERGQFAGDVREIREAQQAAAAAWRALSLVRDKLDSASSWSTYDPSFGRELIGSAIKHSRLDDVARAAADADRCLTVMRTELSDVYKVAPAAGRPAAGSTISFIDVWFENIFTDLAVRDRISQAQRNVARSMQLVRDVHSRLEQRRALALARLATIEAERHDLLTQR